MASERVAERCHDIPVIGARRLGRLIIVALVERDLQEKIVDQFVFELERGFCAYPTPLVEGWVNSQIRGDVGFRMIPTKYVHIRGERHPDGLAFAAVRSGFGGYGESGAGTPLQSLALHEIAAEGLRDQAPQVETELLVAFELQYRFAIVAIGEKGIERQHQ